MLKTEYAKNIATVFTGNSLAQIIPLLIAPLVSRLYAPEDYALYANYLALAQLFFSIAGLRYEQAILLPKEDAKALALLKLSMVAAVSFSLLGMGTILGAKDTIASYFGRAELPFIFYLLPLTIAVVAYYQNLYQWATRFKWFKMLSKVQIVQASAVAGGNLLFGLFGWSSFGLILAHFIGVGISGAVFTPRSWRLVKTIKGTKGYKLLKLATEYKDFPNTEVPKTLLDTFFTMFLLNFIVTDLFGLRELGLLAFAMRYVRVPARVVATSIANVFYKEMVEELALRRNRLKLTFIKTLKIALIPALPACLVLLFFGPSLFGFVFGEKWIEAGSVASRLSPLIFCNFMFGPVQSIPMIFKKQRLSLLFRTLNYCVQIMSLYVGYSLFENFMDTVTLYSVVAFFGYAGTLYWYYQLISKVENTKSNFIRRN